MSWQYGGLRPTCGWDLLASLGHRSKFQRISRLGSFTARHSTSGRQPKFAALNSGRHLHSEGRPSRWTLAHILVVHLTCETSRQWQRDKVDYCNPIIAHCLLGDIGRENFPVGQLLYIIHRVPKKVATLLFFLILPDVHRFLKILSLLDLAVNY